MNPAKFDGVDDCAQLGYLSEAAVLYNLKLRYEAKIIYVRISIYLFFYFVLSLVFLLPFVPSPT